MGSGGNKLAGKVLMKRVKVISTTIDYSNDWIQVYRSEVELHGGKRVNWYTPRVSDFVVVVPIQGTNVYLTREWRIAWKKHLVIPPAGSLGLGKTTEEQRVRQARNELREEIGFDAKSIMGLGRFSLSSRIKSRCYVYLARDLFRNKKARDEGEYIETVKMPFEKALQWSLSGRLLTTSYTIAALAMAKRVLDHQMNSANTIRVE
jgi:8-oxo-dGTP pyrophosphatase MutT (NUDIX family)